jgi:NAD(P)-dependent dehydrogenase (short-subunit alcohol dehydrogenase family)
MSVVLVTGAATGIGNLTARAVAADGHTVYASMRDVGGRNATHARDLLDAAKSDDIDLRVAELDVQSEDSARQAVTAIVDEAGRLDVVVHNAGHLYLGYAEAFTLEDVTRLFDVNVLGMHRVNRAVLPHMRERRSGTLVYVGSTTTVSMPPFLAPYVASKAAFDAFAQTTGYEVSQFGIETVIVMPGAFTHGTEHFPGASHASDQAVAAGYAPLDPLVARYEEASAGLVAPGVDDDPATVAAEIVRVLALPAGAKPARSVVDFTATGDPSAVTVERVNALARQHQQNFITRMGFGQLLELQP